MKILLQLSYSPTTQTTRISIKWHNYNKHKLLFSLVSVYTNYKSLMAVTFVTLSNSDAAAPKTPTAAILLPPATAWEYDAITLSKNPPTELTLIWAGFVGGIIWGIKLFWKWSTWAEFVLNNFIFYFVYLTPKNSFNGFTHLCCSFEKRKIPLLVNDFDQYSHIVVGKVIASLNRNFFNCTFAF